MKDKYTWLQNYEGVLMLPEEQHLCGLIGRILVKDLYN